MALQRLRLNPLTRAILLLVGALGASGAHAQVSSEAPGNAGADGPAGRALPAVSVEASADASAQGLQAPYAGGQVARGSRVGVLGPQDTMATPFTIHSYTQALIQDQQAASVGDVLLNDSAVRVARGFGNFQQVYMIRGLPVFSDDMTYNGLYGLLPRQYLAAELIERVEVLRGANGFLNGAAPGGSSLGGAVNIVPKRASSEPLTQVTAGTESGGSLYAAGDFARRYSDDRLGLRLAAVHRDGDTALDGESRQLDAFVAGLDWREADLRVSADLGFQDHRMKASQPSVTIAPGLSIPDAPDASRSLAQPWTFSNARDVFGTLRAEYDFAPNITGWIAVGGREGEESGSFANPTVFNANGDTTATRFDNVRRDSIATGEIGVRTDVKTGSVGHALSVSFTGYRLDSENAYGLSDFSGFASNLHAPTAVPAPSPDFFTGGSFANPLLTDKTRTSSIALADVMSLLDGRLLLTVGLRQQRIATTTYDYGTGAELTHYDDSAITPVLGALYRLDPTVSIYGAYIEGLVRGDTAPATSGGQPVGNAGEGFEPYRTKQLEAGVKYDGGRIGGSASLFQSRKPIAGVDADNIFGIVGRQRNRGLDLSVYGLAATRVKILGGLTLLDTDVDGHDAIGAPRLQANLGLEWSPAGWRGLVLEGRAIHTGSQYADAANTQELDSWTRVDIGARYSMPVGQRQWLTLRARIENIADTDYWASAGGFPGAGYLTLGDPRTFVVSASLDF